MPDTNIELTVDVEIAELIIVAVIKITCEIEFAKFNSRACFPQDLYKACEAPSGALKAVVPGAVDGPEWVDQSPVGLSPGFFAATKSHTS